MGNNHQHDFLENEQPDIVEIEAGKIRGLLLKNNVRVFKGIPYGASTAGPARFMPATKPKQWIGIRETFHFAPQCPQVSPVYGDADTQQFFCGALEPLDSVSEDCLALNVWAPIAKEGKRFPVMVWCHGGGFDQGSGGSQWDDGAHLAQFGDVVVVTLNHRLNIFGFLHLGEIGGERYSQSGNVGMLDIVLALEWVRDNIAAFGGDSSNVTLFGQSGGGFKISALLAMPGAKGLFHKAIIQSGSALRMATRADAARATELLLVQLGLSANQLDKLHQLPAANLHQAMMAVQESMGGVLGLRVFCPVVDGIILPADPIEPVAQAIATGVPLLIGATQDETRSLLGAGAFLLDHQALPDAVQQFTGLDRATAVHLIEIYSAELPNSAASDIYFAITTDHMFRINAIQQASQKVLHEGLAAAYMYLFAWQAPTFGGKFKAAHAADEPFVFGNLDRAPGLGGVSETSVALSEKMMRAWIAFAYTGNPNHSGLPYWPPYDMDSRATLLFNNICQIANDPEQGRRLTMQSIGKSKHR